MSTSSSGRQAAPAQLLLLLLRVLLLLLTPRLRTRLAPLGQYTSEYWHKFHSGYVNGQYNEVIGLEQCAKDDPFCPQMMSPFREDYWADKPGQALFKIPAKHKEKDKAAAYFNPRFPWIQAIWKVQIRSHLPSQYHIQRVEFPRHLTDTGHHIVQFMWRGYTGCVDAHVLSDSKPVQNSSRDMVGYRVTGPDRWEFIRYDHTAYDIDTYALTASKPTTYDWSITRTLGPVNRGCHIVPPPGQLNSAGISHEQAMKEVIQMCKAPPRRQLCGAVQCVPLQKPPLVLFAERNSPRMTPANDRYQCNHLDEYAAVEPEGSMVCYPVRYWGDLWAARDNFGPHDGRAVEPWTTTEDPRE